jgi:hypothetical protein
MAPVSGPQPRGPSRVPHFGAQQGSQPHPSPVTAVWSSGFENQVAAYTNAGAGLANTVTGTIGAATDQFRSGAASLKYQAAGAGACIDITAVGSPSVMVSRSYHRFNALPTGADAIIVACLVGLQNCDIILTTGGVLQAKVDTGTAVSGPTINTGQWYRIDARFDLTRNPTLISWQVDGVDQSSATLAQAATTINSYRLGVSTATAATLTGWIDDAIISTTASDYPIGPGYSKIFTPNGKGTHVPGAGAFQDDTAAAITDAGDAAGQSWLRIDEQPPNATDFIAQTTADSTGYLEYALTDSSEGNAPNSVSVWFASHATTAANCDISVKTNDNGTITAGSTNTMALTSEFYSREVLARRPSTGLAWTEDAVSSLLLRAGYAVDATPDPCIDAVWVEVDYVGVAPSGVVNQTVNAPVATASATGPTPTVQLEVDPAAATASASAPAPVMPIVAPVATATASAPTPAVQLQVAPAAATATASAPTPTPQLQVAPAAATATASAPTPTVQLQVSPAAATATASAPNPVMPIVVPVATASANSPPATPQLQLTPAAATASASAPLPTLKLQVAPAAATASASSPAPVLPIVAPAATASASAPLPTPKLQVSPPAGTASASAPLPGVDVKVSPAAATATASAPTPRLPIAVPVATASASSPIPTVTAGSGNQTVSPPAASATASAPTPTVALRVSPAAATASASGPTPTVSVAQTVTAPAATASAAAIAPTLALRLSPPAATASASSPGPSDGDTVPVPAASASASAPVPTLSLPVGGFVIVPLVTAVASAPTPKIHHIFFDIAELWHHHENGLGEFPIAPGLSLNTTELFNQRYRDNSKDFPVTGDPTLTVDLEKLWDQKYRDTSVPFPVDQL